MSDRLHCTVCGRQIPPGEWCDVRITRNDTSITKQVVCSLHDRSEVPDP